MANIGAILKALATWQPTSGLSRQQLAQDFGQTSRFATFDQKPNRAPVVNADVPPDRPELSMIDAPISQPAQTTGINLMGGVPGQPSNEPQVQQFTPEPMPEGQSLPDELPQADPALLAALNQNQGAQPWQTTYADAQTPAPWSAGYKPVVSVPGAGYEMDGQSQQLDVPEYTSEGYNLMPPGEFAPGGNFVGGGNTAAAHFFSFPDRDFSYRDPAHREAKRRIPNEDDMMRRSREYQDMVLNLLARSRGNG